MNKLMLYYTMFILQPTNLDRKMLPPARKSRMEAPLLTNPIGTSFSSPSVPSSSSLPTRSKEQIAISRILRHYRNLNLPQIKQIHGRLFRLRLHHDPILLTKLVNFCSTTGAVSYAVRLFHSHPSPDIVLLNSVLKALTFNSLPLDALLFFLDQIPKESDFLRPDGFTFPYLLKACAAVSNGFVGVQLHGLILKMEGISCDGFVLNSLADMYFKCGEREMAVRVLKGGGGLDDAVAWNVMLNGVLGVGGDLEGAIQVFETMPIRDVVSWNTMLSAYAKAGRMEDAQKLFEQMPERNLVSWNGLIAGYARNGDNDRALEVFSEMLSEGIEPDSATMVTVASACRLAAESEKVVVDRISAFSQMVNSVSVSTALLSLYSKLGKLEEAKKLFDSIPEKDLVSWNAMIGGYSQNQRPFEAIDLFQKMQEQKLVRPDGITMASLVDSCSQTGALGLGEWIHAYIRKNKIEMDTFLVTALVDMYAKCGDLDKSRILFSEIPEKDLASWNAMIKGLAVHGKGEDALEIFHLMEKDGLSPNEITFIGLLSACSHGGLVTKGLEIFESMQKQYGVVPKIEHYGCVVDILGRSGRLSEAIEFINKMPLKPDSIVWGALLGACRSHQNLELAELAASRLLELEPKHDGNYILLSNVYASKGKWDKVEKVRARMRATDIQKEPGFSAVELDGLIHEFRAGDRSHPRSSEIYQVWDEVVKLLKPMGYEPDTSALLKNLDEEDKEEALSRHSEKLALSLALISSNSGSTIRIVKNLRICTDCHRAMELVSQLKGREIVVRDRNRFHHFSAGSCSCGGYW